MIWDIVSELLRFPRSKIMTDYIEDTGHLNSNDSFVHYARAVTDSRLRPGDIALLVNPGFGGTRGCTALRC
jgi:3-oxoacyl-[acyl-carrier-protein] synthase-3